LIIITKILSIYNTVLLLVLTFIIMILVMVRQWL